MPNNYAYSSWVWLNGRYIQIDFIHIWSSITALTRPGLHKFSKNLGVTSKFCARRIKQSEFETEDRKILGANLQNFVACVTWHPDFVHPWTGLWAAQLQFEFFSLWLCLVQLWLLPSCSSTETKAVSWPLTSTWCWDMNAWCYISNPNCIHEMVLN